MRPDWAIAFAEDGRIGRARERPSGVAHASRIVHSLLRRRLPPEVGVATLELLERFGLDVEYPCDRTCCGQPMTNTGCQAESAATEALFVRNFAPYDYVVTPSGSCAHQVRFNLDAVEETEEARRVRAKTFELVEFLHDIVKADALPWAAFPHRVALHNNCQTLRGLRIASMSELREEPFSKPMNLLGKVKGIEFVHLARPD
jgi:L-lactate dehydrogenase complex protein LldE